ncbi:hypothetical protein OsJ_34456 [Oryza sativa Japonica Group]|uniref:Uncharacterized protein n=3 Tax=Oryza TaxID=4527 RepID=A0A8J8XW19_ORYSJ|nr:hypothetical protein LOC_Os11g38280 [Oryza sativa Japonica Group]EAZ18918.1 hypothetical protein OsJ_34456 [Oryza sativa Japonica Group]
MAGEAGDSERDEDEGHGGRGQRSSGVRRWPWRTRPTAAAAVTDEDCDLVECDGGGQRWTRTATQWSATAAATMDEGSGGGSDKRGQ